MKDGFVDSDWLLESTGNYTREVWVVSNNKRVEELVYAVCKSMDGTWHCFGCGNHYWTPYDTAEEAMEFLNGYIEHEKQSYVMA